MRRPVAAVLVVVGCTWSEVRAPSALPFESMPAVSFTGCDGFGTGGIPVASTEELNAALASARPGHVIRLRSNTVTAAPSR